MSDEGFNESVDGLQMICTGKDEFTVSVVLAIAIAHYKLWRQRKRDQEHLNEIEGLLDAATRNRAAERMGRSRAEVKHCTRT